MGTSCSKEICSPIVGMKIRDHGCFQKDERYHVVSMNGTLTDIIRRHSTSLELYNNGLEVRRHYHAHLHAWIFITIFASRVPGGETLLPPSSTLSAAAPSRA